MARLAEISSTFAAREGAWISCSASPQPLDQRHPARTERVEFLLASLQQEVLAKQACMEDLGLDLGREDRVAGEVAVLDETVSSGGCGPDTDRANDHEQREDGAHGYHHLPGDGHLAEIEQSFHGGVSAPLVGAMLVVA